MALKKGQLNPVRSDRLHEDKTSLQAAPAQRKSIVASMTVL